MKYQFIQAHQSQHRIERLCQVLAVSRSGYYAGWHRPFSARARANAALVERMTYLHRQLKERYGALKLWRALVADGVPCGRHRVARLRRQQGLLAKRTRRFRVMHEPHEFAPPAPNRLHQQFVAAEPNRIWAGDLTAIATRAGWVYLAVILALYSRRVIGWAMSRKPDQQVALTHRRPRPGLIHHTDQGATYTSLAYQRQLTQTGLVASMSRKGNCCDNAVVESFFNTLKNELVHDQNFWTREEAQAAVFEFIEVFYNRQRLHQSLGYISPSPVQCEAIYVP